MERITQIRALIKSGDRERIINAIRILKTEKPAGAANLLRNLIADTKDKQIEELATKALLVVLFEGR